MKKVFDYKFNSENMKKNILQKYDSKKVNSVKVLKLVMPVLLITLTVLAITNNKPNTIIMNNDTLVFNKELINTGKVDGVILDIDGKSVNTDIISNHDFLKDIKIPESYLLSNQFAIYEKENEFDTNYSKLWQYVLVYSSDDDKSIEISFTKESHILSCVAFIKEDFIKSTINGNSVYLLKGKNHIQAHFDYKGYKLFIEASNINDDDFINLVRSILK